MSEAFKSLVDVHCHILPGIDDGPKGLEESLDIGKLYVKAGFRTVVATPHCIPGTSWMPEVQVVREKTRQVAGGLRDAGVLLHIHCGMEIALDPLVPQLLAEGRVLTLGDGPYVMIECPFQRLPLGWEAILGDITRMGYRVLLAHPERCADLSAKSDLVREIAASGVGVQVNWDSLAGMNGRQVLDVARAFLEEQHIHCIATDTHDKVRRSPSMVRQGWDAVKALVGEDNLRRLMIDNPRRVLMGGKLEPMEDLPQAKTAKRKWFWFS